MKVLKYLLPVAVVLYLYLAYAGFYNFTRKMNLKSPYTSDKYTIENGSGTGSTKYVSLGDSLTAGVGANDISKTLPYFFASDLLKTYKEVTVINTAQPGGTTEDVINFQLSRAIDEKPQHVTLLIGINDMHNRRTLKDFHDKYSFILNELMQNTSAQIVVINMPYLGSDKTVHFPYNLLLKYRTNQYNSQISSVVESFNSDRIKLVNLYENTYTISKQDPDYYSSDNFHPSEKGYEFWSRFINAN